MKRRILLSLLPIPFLGKFIPIETPRGNITDEYGNDLSKLHFYPVQKEFFMHPAQAGAYITDLTIPEGY